MSSTTRLMWTRLPHYHFTLLKVFTFIYYFLLDCNSFTGLCFCCTMRWISCQFSSVAQSCSTLCDPMDAARQGLPVHHQLPEFTQTHIHWVGDAIQPSHPLSSLLPLPSIFPSIGVFSKWVSSSDEVAKVLEFQLQHQFFQWTPRTDLL